MTFTYQFEPADWIAFNVHYLKNSRVHQRQRFWACFGVVVGFLALGLVVLLAREKDVGLAISLSVIGVVMFFAYPKVYDDSILKRIKKTVDDPDNAKTFGRETVTLTPEGFHTSRPGAEATIAWDNVLKLAETPDHIFLYLSAVNAIVIPRRSLEGASFEAAKRQLQQYMGMAAPAPG